jgi:hypothetical protein
VTSRYNIFLSYSHGDGENACTHFESSIPVVWKAWRDIARLAGGDDWKEKARHAIRRCDTVIALMTPEAVGSEAVIWEWKTALEYGKHLIPLVILECSIPEFLGPQTVRRDLTGEKYTYAPTEIMSEIDQRWREVEAEFADLQSDLTARPHDMPQFLSKCLADLERKLHTRPNPAMPPEIFKAWFDIVRSLLNEYPRVDETINRLVEGLYRDSSDGDFRSIIKAQHDLYFKPGFMRLRSELPGIHLPVVVVAVTDKEVKQLESEAIFEKEDLVLREEFVEMRAMLGPTDWAASYGGEPEQWRPFGGAETISELILEAVAGVISRGEITDRIVPRYADLMHLDLTSEFQELRRCSIVVVDYVSTRYPPLQARFRKSGLDVSTEIPIILVGVYDLMQRPPDDRFLIKRQFDWQHDRRRETNDPHCDAVWERTRLLKFLGSEIPRVLAMSMQSRNRRTGIQAQFNRFLNS